MKVQGDYSRFIRRQHCLCCGMTPAIAKEIKIPEFAGALDGSEGLTQYCLIPVCLECQDTLAYKVLIEDRCEVIFSAVIAYLGEFIKDKPNLFLSLAGMANFQRKMECKMPGNGIQ